MQSFFVDHSLIILLSLATLCTFAWFYTQRRRLDLNVWMIAIAAILHTAWGVLTVKVFAAFEAGFAPGSFGQMSLFGGLFLMPLLYFAAAWFLRLLSSVVFDIAAPAMLFTLMCARVNCLISGCCQGLPIHGTNMQWPTRELELVYYIVFLSLMTPRVARGRTKGEVYPLYMISYGIFRFLIEGFRVSSSNSYFHMAHLWAILASFAGVAIYMELLRKSSARH